MSDLEDQFEFNLKALQFKPPVREYKFHPTRKWRFDFAWPDEKVAVEIEGGIWGGGRHTRGSGYTKDCEKYNVAVVMGWRVLRLTSPMIDELEWEGWLKELL